MADTTTMFVVGLYHYYQWTGDQATLNKLWPAAKRAMAWVTVDSTKGVVHLNSRIFYFVVTNRVFAVVILQNGFNRNVILRFVAYKK